MPWKNQIIIKKSISILIKIVSKWAKPLIIVFFIKAAALISFLNNSRILAIRWVYFNIASNKAGYILNNNSSSKA